MDNLAKRGLAAGFGLGLGLGLTLGYFLAGLRQESIEIAALRKRNSALQASLMPAPAPAPATPPSLPAAEPNPPQTRVIVRERSIPESAPAVPDSQLRDRLDRLAKFVKDLEYQLEVEKTSTAQAVEESRRWQTATKDLEEKLNSSNRIADAVQAQFRTASERLSQLQLDLAALKRENAKLSESKTQASSQSKELEDLNRRREAYLADILRRYREITDQYRTVAQRSTPSAELAPGELSRIQSAIGMAEEDLRQLNSLNAQAKRLRN